MTFVRQMCPCCAATRGPSEDPLKVYADALAVLEMPGRVPSPVRCLLDQVRANRTEVHVIELLDRLLLRVSIEGIVPWLPEGILAIDRPEISSQLSTGKLLQLHARLLLPPNTSPKRKRVNQLPPSTINPPQSPNHSPPSPNGSSGSDESNVFRCGFGLSVVSPAEGFTRLRFGLVFVVRATREFKTGATRCA